LQPLDVVGQLNDAWLDHNGVSLGFAVRV
jgi:hypothetical protein